MSGIDGVCPITLNRCAECGVVCHRLLAAQAERAGKPEEVSPTFRGLLWCFAIEGLVAVLLLFLILVAVA
jgi:hypothetical protein